MKKIFLMLVLASLSVAVSAQDNDAIVQKYSVATNSFWSNWFIQANISGLSFYSNQEKGLGLDKSPFSDFRTNLGFSVAFGKWFTPVIGLRTKFNGIWGRTVLGKDAKTNAEKFFTLHEQVLFNISNLLCGYNETRVWNFNIYAGTGITRCMTYDTYAMGWSAGILNTWRLGKRVLLNLDLGYNMSEKDADGVTIAKDYPRGSRQRDQYFSAELGLTFNIGKVGWSKVPDVDAIKALSQSQIDALNAQLEDARKENARLRDELANRKPVVETKTVEVKQVVSAPVSVYFNINKTQIASKKDLQNVYDLAEIAKANNSKLIVTGYADSATGTEEINQALSQGRAEALVEELVNMGVDRDNIEVVAAGGVDTLSPISYNRRATVAIK